MGETPHVHELFDLTGKGALVIGGTGYLGRALAEALAEAGARVAIGSRDRSRAADAAAGLPLSSSSRRPAPGAAAEGGAGLPGGRVQHVGVVCDVTDEQANRAGVDAAAAELGRLDILVTCTVGHRRVNLDAATQADFEGAMSATLIGPFIASQQAALHMRAAGGGSIIHVGSIYGVVGSYPQVFEDLKTPVPPMYHAAKGGIVQLTRYQAVYWARDNIRVNCLSPGPFPPHSDSPSPAFRERQGGLLQNQPSSDLEFQRRLAGRVPLGRCGIPWELKGAVVFLASRASSYVTGHNLLVDGGWTAW